MTRYDGFAKSTPLVVALATLCASVNGHAAVDRQAACKTASAVSAEPQTVHARLFAANGGGSGYRLSVVGTSRIMWVSKAVDPPVPPEIESLFKPFDDELYGDFMVVPMEPDVQGRMREVCLVSGQGLVVKHLSTGRSEPVTNGANP